MRMYRRTVVPVKMTPAAAKALRETFDERMRRIADRPVKSAPDPAAHFLDACATGRITTPHASCAPYDED